MNQILFKKTIASLIAIVSFSLFLTIQASAATMEYEVNNDFSTANSVKAGVEVTGYLQEEKDTDYFTFTTTAEGHIYASIDNLPKNYDLYLYDANHKRIAYSTNSSTNSEEINVYNQPPGTYYIQVKSSSYDKYNSYTLLTMYPTQNVTYDNTTLEPNNSMENGYRAESGKEYSTFISSSVDKDWYKFTTSEAGEIRLALWNLPENYDLYIYNSKKEKISYSTNGSTNPESITLTDQPAGTYYVLVNGNLHYNTYRPYSFKASYATTSIKHNDVTLEPNDSLQIGYPAVSGRIYSEKISDATDTDVFQFTTKKTGQIRAALYNLPKNYDLYVYDKLGKRLAHSTNGGTNKESITLDQMPAGTYYVKVIGNTLNYSNDRSYNIKISYPIATLTQSNVDFEPNDSLENAYYLKADKAVYSKIDNELDVDWYQINAKTNTPVSVELSNLPENYDLKVYDSYGNRLYSSTNSSKNTERINFNSKNVGTFYIRVDSNSAYNTERYYTLKANYQTAVSVYLDGERMALEKAPIVSNGSTLLPMRAIFEALGAKVDWNQKTQSILATKDKTIIKLIINSKVAYRNDVKMTLSVVPFVQDYSTFVPLRFISESLGAKVDWIQNSQTVKITTK